MLAVACPRLQRQVVDAPSATLLPTIMYNSIEIASPLELCGVSAPGVLRTISFLILLTRIHVIYFVLYIYIYIWSHPDTFTRGSIDK